MAKSNAVWGIDIGQCALKALRCRAHPDDPNQIVADAFDYIEYPKILSQPEAEPEEIVREAIEQFLSRNEVRGDQIAISVSGQSGLARFIKLPPVEAKKIPDIVKYEARQQIPFSLEDVVWDYQQLAGGSEDDGFALEIEIGLFAMKRDQVFRALKPLDEAGIKVDFIQLAPLAIYNYIVFDQSLGATPLDEYDPENPPPSTVVISLGTDTTDLVVTNGFRVWQRSIPIGGSHFTKALTKELRLTFSKAEHLKRNATEAENPKVVFQAMRPVFSDLLTEIQRSIGYFSSMDQSAKIGNVVALGNAMKLPGLGRYLSQNLGHDVVPVASFRGLDGSAVTESPQFKDNLLGFGTCYGLCLQALKKASIHTNLLPREIVTERLIRDKKPWVVAMAAALLVGCTINYFGYWSAWRSADVERQDFKAAFNTAKAVQTQSSSYKTQYTAEKKKFDDIDKIGKNLVSNVDGRLAWLEVLKALDASLPRETNPKQKTIGQRHELHIESLECQKFDELNTWYAGISKKYRDDHGLAVPAGGAAPVAQAAPVGDDDDDDDDTPSAPVSASAPGPKGPGWVIELRGHHFYNDDLNTRGAVFIRQTLLSHLKDGNVELPGGTFKIKDIGIGYPVLVQSDNPVSVKIPDEEAAAKAAALAKNVAADGKPKKDKDANAASADAAPKTADAKPPKAKAKVNAANLMGGMLGGEPLMIDAMQCTFTVQFCWQPTPASERHPEPSPSAPSETPSDTPADAAETAATDVPADDNGLAKNQPAGN